jgi:hypothetical protein
MVCGGFEVRGCVKGTLPLQNKSKRAWEKENDCLNRPPDGRAYVFGAEEQNGLRAASMEGGAGQAGCIGRASDVFIEGAGVLSRGKGFLKKNFKTP